MSDSGGSPWCFYATIPNHCELILLVQIWKELKGAISEEMAFLMSAGNNRKCPVSGEPFRSSSSNCHGSYSLSKCYRWSCAAPVTKRGEQANLSLVSISALECQTLCDTLRLLKLGQGNTDKWVQGLAKLMIKEKQPGGKVSESWESFPLALIWESKRDLKKQWK